jgi:hypothetical protein
MADRAAQEKGGTRVPRWARSLLPVLVALGTGLTACDVVRGDTQTHHHADAADVASVAGWTRIGVTSDYLLVINVLPSEAMYTASEVESMQPTMGEAILHGTGEPVGPGVRHVEAHIYDRATGIAVSDVKPVIRVFNRTTGDRIEVPATLMQDVLVGAADIHWGNNVPVRGDSDISVEVSLGSQEVTIDGHLD